MQRSKHKFLPTFGRKKQVNSQELPIIRQGEDLLIDARLLHQQLESRQEFSSWIKNRIKKYGFRENDDYLISLSNRSGGRSGKPRTDYLLIVDMAKEIAMLERNETGRRIRHYFIQAEKKARGVPVFPVEKEIFEGVTCKKINDRVMLLNAEVRERLGYSTRRSSGSERNRYWMHFIKEGNRLYCTMEYAMHKYHSRKVYANRKALKQMQPVLPLNFGDPQNLLSSRRTL